MAAQARARRLVWLLAVLGGLAACGERRDGDLLEVRMLVTETRTDHLELPGQTVPATIDTITLWLGPGLARRDAPEGTYLVDLQRDRLTYVQHATRTWVSGSIADVQQLFHRLATDTLDQRREERRLRLLKIMLNMSARVTDTGEQARIDGYRSSRWIVEQHLGEQAIISELWLTREIDVDYELLHHAARPALLAVPGGEAAMAEMARLRGVPVRTTSELRLLGREGRAESRLLRASRVRVPRDFFAPPADYRPSVQPGR